MAGATADRVSVDGWDECVRLHNSRVELIAPTAVGPRIVSFGLRDGPNELHTIESDLGERGGDEYRYYGGHRLWYAPEVAARTTIPDNDPLECTVGEGTVELLQPVEASTGIRKAIHVAMADDEPSVTVTHRLTNEGLWPVELAPWGITVLRGGGVGVLPVTGADGDGRLPDRSLSIWPYTDLGDDRLELASGHVRISQRSDADPLKVGTSGEDGWIAYVNDGRAFVKTYDRDTEATYPDRDCAAEIYTDGTMQELETLAPLRTLEPGSTVEHVETWRLYDDVPTPGEAPLSAYPFV